MVSFTTILLASAAVTISLAAPLDDSELISRIPDFDFSQLGSNLTRRQTYSTDYTTGGTVNYSPGALGQYSVTFSQANDFVVGKGWNPGNASPITYSGSFSATSGTVSLQIYGWTTNPLVEYYVVENYYPSAPSASVKGTVSSDGGTYNIYASQKTNQPSIEGTANFLQIKSVRTSPRSSGTVTTANHFDAWKGLGLGLGTQNLQVVAVEGYSKASGSVTMNLGYA
ncbi:Endo-1,4-beta-xylanase [Lachnellula willkommii]|uniref:Endo-1,4-beta-xylanase n=1 Tax=Lachnellula willkommii TaxID=215461 RepID=A0A559LZ55_9HELO|nr:Endo-1,4-beta-xylanase [Lachnellula willkommii]